MTNFLYVISTVKNGEHCAPVKIGRTQNVASRLAMLQTGCPADLAVTFAFPLADKAMAHAVEKMAHADSDASRLRGEWFNLHPFSAVQNVCVAINAHCLDTRVPEPHYGVNLGRFGVSDAWDHICKLWPLHASMFVKTSGGSA